MKKTLITIIATVLLSILTACTGGEENKEKAADIGKEYSSDKLGIELDYPETFTVEETENSLTVYHFKEQPVPYFVINVSEKTIDALVGELKTTILKREESEFNNMDATKITAFHEELGSNVDTFYIEYQGKTYWFSCLNGLYDEICNSIEFTE